MTAPASDLVATLAQALIEVRILITEGALTGFNPKDGDWAERLYKSQGDTARALKSAGYEIHHTVLK